MATEWMTPLVTSALRLVMILALFLVNAGALWLVATRSKYKRGPRNHERFSIITILFLNIIYLLIIWAPFTISAFRQDLLNLHEGRGNIENILPSIKEADASEFVVEYIDLRTGKVVAEKPDMLHRMPRAVHEKHDAEFNILPSLRIHLPEAPKNDSSHPSKHPVNLWSIPSTTELKKSHSSWNTDVQDLETSSCAYSLALTGVVRMVIARRPALRPTRPLSVMIGSVMLVVVPVVITGLTRIIGSTTAHFALHKPEISDSGYAIYNIICDVHITEAYVLSLFLEWVMLFTLAIIALGLGLGLGSKKEKTYSEEGMKENANSPGSVETWAQDFVLVLGAIWAWPVKPLFVLILYCHYGAHWTNVVCWLANAVVAIPVVLMPQAVFLSRFQKKPSPFNNFITDHDIITAEEASNTREKDGSEEAAKASDEDKAGTTNNDCITKEKERTNYMAEEYGHNIDTMFISPTQVPQEEKHYAQTNLKFYLGTDIMKHNKISTSMDDDECVTLKSEWNPSSEV